MAITDCALNTSFPMDCSNAKAGIKIIAFAQFTDALAFNGASGPTNASGIITAWSGANGKFYKYGAAKGNIEVSGKRTTSKQNGTSFAAYSLKTKLNKLTADKSQEVLKLEGTRAFVLITDRNNQSWLVGGYNGVDITEVNEMFGVAMGDFNGLEIIGSGEEEYPMMQVSNSIVAALYT